MINLNHHCRHLEPKKWYVSTKSFGTITEKEVAKQIADEITLNPKEAEMALYQLRKVVIRNLLNGYTVKLGDWATFYTTVSSEGSSDENEANASKVKKIKLHLLHNKSFEQELQKATFVNIESLQTKENTETNP